VKRKDKHSFSNGTTTEAMIARGMSPNHRKGKREIEKSKTGGREELKKSQCAFCREEGH